MLSFFFIVRLAAHVANGCKFLIHPGSGKDTAKTKGVIGIFYIIGAISEASEPKCIKSGCDNKQATNSSYCYLHKPYTGSGSSHSNSSYSNKSSSSSSSSSHNNKSTAGSNTSSYNSSTKKRSTGTSSSNIIIIRFKTDLQSVFLSYLPS